MKHLPSLQYYYPLKKDTFNFGLALKFTFCGIFYDFDGNICFCFDGNLCFS